VRQENKIMKHKKTIPRQPVTSDEVLEIQQIVDQFVEQPDTIKLITLRRRIDQVINSHLNQGRSPKFAPSVVPTPAQKQLIRHRSKNIIIHGLETDKEITNQGVKDQVRDFLTTILKADVEPISAHLLGQSDRKPIRVCLQNMNDKKEIYKNCHLLKSHGAQYRITDDLSYEQRLQRRNLHVRLNQEKALGNQTRIKHNTLYVNGVPIFGLGTDDAQQIIHKHVELQQQAATHHTMALDPILSSSLSSLASSTKSSKQRAPQPPPRTKPE